MITAQYIIKSLFSAIGYQTGLFHLIQKGFYAEKAVVLMYHRVLSSLDDEKVFVQPGMYVTENTFRQHMEVLKANFRILPLSELVFRLRNGREIGGCCAITFDDGWLDNYLYAYPILKEFQVPATIFLASSLIGSNKLFWPEELSYYLKQSDFRIKAGNGKIVIRLLKQLPEPKTEDQFLDQSIMQVKKWPLSERQELLDCLRVVFQRSTDHHRMLINWKEAQTMLKSGMVDFGAHTANHVILDQVSAGVAQQEIQKSRDEIGHHLGIDVELFSYPNGNFSPDLKQMVRKNRFKGAVTTQAAWVSKDTDLFAIPRIGIHEDVSFSKQRFFSRLILKRF